MCYATDTFTSVATNVLRVATLVVKFHELIPTASIWYDFRGAEIKDMIWFHLHLNFGFCG